MALDSNSTMNTTRQFAQNPMQYVDLYETICFHVCCRASAMLAHADFVLVDDDALLAR
jgi:hypothetical protein